MDLWTSMGFCIHIYEEASVTMMNDTVVSSSAVMGSFWITRERVLQTNHKAWRRVTSLCQRQPREFHLESTCAAESYLATRSCLFLSSISSSEISGSSTYFLSMRNSSCRASTGNV